jgi:signal peptidase I
MREFLKALGNFILDTLEIITTAFALFVVMFLFVVQIHEVKGDSMLPNFHNREFVLTDKLTYHFREPQRGEIVIFKAPPKPRDEYIKRLVALPGEKIKIQNNQITIYNQEHPEGFVLEESYLAPGTATTGKTAIPPNTEVTIPDDEFVVMGDNRGASSDSRSWGPVKKDLVVGRAVVRIWPPTAVSLVRHAKYGE